jgi:hypothetical protein
MSVYKKQTINGFWKVDKTLARLLGCHLSVIVLDELLFHEMKHADETGWFWFQVEKLEEVCMIGRHARRKCFEILERFKILQIEKRGIPCRYFYKINGDRIDELINGCSTTEVKPDHNSEVKTNPTVEVKTNPTYIRRNIKNKKEEVEDSNSGAQPTKTTDSHEVVNQIHCYTEFLAFVNSVPYFRRLKAPGWSVKLKHHYGTLECLDHDFQDLWIKYTKKKRFPGDGGLKDESWYSDCYSFIENCLIKTISK